MLSSGHLTVCMWWFWRLGGLHALHMWDLVLREPKRGTVMYRPPVRFAWSPPSSWATGPDVGDSVWAKHWLRSPHAPLMCTHLCHLYLSHTHTLWHSSTLEPTHTLSLSLSPSYLSYVISLVLTHRYSSLLLFLHTNTLTLLDTRYLSLTLTVRAIRGSKRNSWKVCEQQPRSSGRRKIE